MAGNTYSVRPGAPQQITGAPLSTDTVIVNNDPSGFSVWLGSDITVSPGNGIELTPGATATWTGKQLWGCVDVGVITPINITVSSDVSQIDNPVAVATAVAIALLESGIPSVFVSVPIFASVPIAAGSSTAITDCSQYSELDVVVVHDPFLVTEPISGTITFFDAQQLTVRSIPFMADVSTTAGRVIAQCSFSTPAYGPFFRVNINGTAGTNDTKVSVTGTNRNRASVAGSATNSFYQNLADTVVSGTFYDKLGAFCCGRMRYSFLTTIHCHVGYYILNPNTMATEAVTLGGLAAGGGLLTDDVVTPLGQVIWWYQALESVTGTAQITFALTADQSF